jgi:hypothetical protein
MLGWATDWAILDGASCWDGLEAVLQSGLAWSFGWSGGCVWLVAGLEKVMGRRLDWAVLEDGLG